MRRVSIRCRLRVGRSIRDTARLVSQPYGGSVLGAAFKPDSDDARNSPALNVAEQIQLQGATTVNVYDPRAMDNSRALFPTLNYTTRAAEVFEGADAVLA